MQTEGDHGQIRRYIGRLWQIRAIRDTKGLLGPAAFTSWVLLLASHHLALTSHQLTSRTAFPLFNISHFLLPVIQVFGLHGIAHCKQYPRASTGPSRTSGRAC